jgi:hypothetical protein
MEAWRARVAHKDFSRVYSCQTLKLFVKFWKTCWRVWAINVLYTCKQACKIHLENERLLLPIYNTDSYYHIHVSILTSKFGI